MNDSFRTNIFVRYPPETIACACIFLSARQLGVCIRIDYILLRTTLAWAGILIFTYSSTVKPVLSRPLLSGHLPKFQKPFSLITAKLTHIMRSPVLSGHAHLIRGPSKLPVCFIAFTSIDLCQAATIAVRKQSFSNLLGQNSHRMTKAY